jgi:hypothetical protein
MHAHHILSALSKKQAHILSFEARALHTLGRACRTCTPEKKKAKLGQSGSTQPAAERVQIIFAGHSCTSAMRSTSWKELVAGQNCCGAC